MSYKSIITALAILLSVNASAQHLNLGIYGGASIMVLPHDFKKYYNTPKATLTPTYGAKLALDIKRFQFGIGFNNWKLEYVQRPQIIHQLPFMEGAYDGFISTLKFNMYQFFINYKIQKTASYFYAGADISYFILQDNYMDYTTNNSDYSLVHLFRPARSNDGIIWGLHAGYNLNVIKGLNVQVESGFRYYTEQLNTLEIVPNPPYYPYPIIGHVTKMNIIDIPLTFGVNYNF